jgi:hypothetical protein
MALINHSMPICSDLFIWYYYKRSIKSVHRCEQLKNYKLMSCHHVHNLPQVIHNDYFFRI